MIDLNALKPNRPKKPIIVIHGPEGIGKTTFAKCAPNPVFIPTEDGFGDLPVINIFSGCEPEKAKAESFKDVMDAIAILYTGEHNFKTVVIDSLDKMEPLIWKSVCDRTGATSIEEVGGGFGKGYVETTNEWNQFMDGIAALRNKRGMYVILIAHSIITTVNDPTQPSYDKHILNLNKRAQSICVDIPDIVGFASWKTYTVKEKGESRNLAMTTGERVLYLMPKPYHTAKNRFHMPEEIPLVWEEFEKALPKSVTGLPE